MKIIKLPACITLCLLASFAAVAQTSWKGTTSTSWATATNWTAGVPTSTTDAIIGDANFTGANQPTISAAATCRSLTIGGTKASTLTISRTLALESNFLINGNGIVNHGGFALTVKGNWINNGIYTTTSNSTSIIFGGVTKAVQGSVVTAFRKWTINAGSVTILNTNVTVSGTGSKLTVIGTLDPNESPTYKITGTAFTVNANAVGETLRKCVCFLLILLTT